MNLTTDPSETELPALIMEASRARLALLHAPAAAPASASKRTERAVSRGFYRLLSASRSGDYRLGFLALAGSLAALFLTVFLHGPALQEAWGHDDIVYLAAGWRVYCGSLPHADFYCALGALNAWEYALGMFILGPTAAVLPFCAVCAGIVFALLGWLVARSRLPALPAYLFAITQALVAASPNILNWDYFTTTYDGYYNRQGYALISILLLLLFLPRRFDSRPKRADSVDGSIAGAIVGVLLFLKITYCMSAFGLCAIAFALQRRHSRALWSHAALGFAIVFLACLPLFHFDLPAMLRDLRMAAGARTGDPTAAFTLTHLFASLPLSWVQIALLAAVQLALRPVGWWWRGPATAESDPAVRAPSWAEFAGVVGLCLFTYMTNAPGGDHGETPLLGAWGFVLLGCALQRTALGSKPPEPRTSPRRDLPVLCAVLAVLWVTIYGTGVQGIGWAYSPWPTPFLEMMEQGTIRFDSASLKPLQIAGYGGQMPMPFTYAEKINDGLRMLRHLGGAHRVEAVDFANPFPFALGWQPAHGGFWCWQNGYGFSDTAHPPPDRAFGDADVLMIPKNPGVPDSFSVMLRLYGSYIKSRFRVQDTSSQWYLLVRR